MSTFQGIQWNEKFRRKDVYTKAKKKEENEKGDGEKNARRTGPL